MAQRSRSYSHETPGEALLFKNIINDTTNQAIRLELPEIGMEYTDNAYIGKDLEGIFYYDAASDISGDAKAKVFKVVANGKKYLHMKFYTSSENETYAEAEFVAEDPAGTVDAAGMDGSVRVANGRLSILAPPTQRSTRGPPSRKLRSRPIQFPRRRS